MNDRTLNYEPSGLQIRPYVRWAARLIDIFLFSLLYGTIVGIISESALNKIPALVLTVLVLIAYIFVEAMMLSSWGTTPGKALSKIRLRCENGSRLSYSQALKRSFSVAVKGLGLGLPLISLFTLLNSYNDLTKKGKTSWDRDGNFSVSHQILGLSRGFVLTLSVISILFINLILIPLVNYSYSE